ncbi:unnamed protein product [Urochloa humidicola]
MGDPANDMMNEKEGDNISTELNLEELINPCEELWKQREQRKWSERIQQNNMEKALKILSKEGKKRPMEGLYNSEMKGLIQEGVKLLLACAQKMKRTRYQQPVLYLPSVEQEDRAESSE